MSIHPVLPPPRESLPPHLRQLLSALVHPAGLADLDEGAWDGLIRSARSARLLGTLAARSSACGLRGIPSAVSRMLDAALVESAFRRQKMRFLLHTVAADLGRVAPGAVVLKGAAYELQDAPIAAGRMPADVDILVPEAALARVEHALLNAGWEFAKTDEYDQRYYRDWSHELPPMRCAGQALELDLHHAILPPVGRLRPDSALLLDAAVPIAGQPYRALSAVDQVLHAAAHVFEDSDGANRLRDVIDVDALMRSCLGEQPKHGAVDRLVQRARVLGLTRPLRYAAAFALRWCDTPAAEEILAASAEPPSRHPSPTVVALMTRTLGPPAPDACEEPGRRWRERALAFRALWLRMPPALVAYHAVSKAWRSIEFKAHRHGDD
ncbi:MAG: nucleotidyltransferase family protein [Burkholderiaceae bacterium]|jgi:hypothetical protein|nr:nucleotidyltransferase family protein [Burkholderiaceae bacterium]